VVLTICDLLLPRSQEEAVARAQQARLHALVHSWAADPAPADSDSEGAGSWCSGAGGGSSALPAWLSPL
jgi:uncharacterized protein (DUF2336 family)